MLSDRHSSESTRANVYLTLTFPPTRTHGLSANTESWQVLSDHRMKLMQSGHLIHLHVMLQSACPYHMTRSSITTSEIVASLNRRLPEGKGALYTFLCWCCGRSRRALCSRRTDSFTQNLFSYHAEHELWFHHLIMVHAPPDHCHHPRISYQICCLDSSVDELINWLINQNVPSSFTLKIRLRWIQ